MLEAQGGKEYSLPLRLNGVPDAHAQGASLVDTTVLERDAPLEGNALLATGTAGDTRADARGDKGERALQTLRVRFPAGSGYTQQTVTVRW